MLDPSRFHDLVSGRQRGVRATLLRGVLAAAEWPYRAAVAWRNQRFERRPEKMREVDVPVISVGNLSLGGTGKTPLVVYLARWFRQHGVRVSLVSRGYGAKHEGRNDEALELEQQLPDVPHLQNSNRFAAAQVAVDELETQLILLDDGFQHRQLARDLDIVLIDALEPFGYGHVFPRGTLREPPSSLRRADIVGLTRADMVDEIRRAWIRQFYSRYVSAAKWIELVHRPTQLVRGQGAARALDHLRGTKALAFCGIGNPAGFEHTLAQLACQVLDWRRFPDHHGYSRADIENLAQWIRSFPAAEMILCTQKDLVKIGLDTLGGKPLFAVQIEMCVRAGGAFLDDQLAQVLTSIPADEEGY
ncbi:MAG: tetraacyldisaccharide 4'-kinase [Planctomycetales bacterium]|nr:tetraacyldisaccharide 4'-kinase [Planctomycetales bacterium]